MAYLLDVNDPTKMYIKTLDCNGQLTLDSYTMTKDQIQEDENAFVTQAMLDEVLDNKLEKMFKKYMNNGRSRNNKNRNNQNREEVDYDE